MVTGVSADTRELAPGDLFVALPGDHVHGSTFISEALAKGAVAVVTETDSHIPTLHSTHPSSVVPVVRVPDARVALSRLAAAFWGHPSRELRVVGITGTDGKTTTTFLTSAVLEAGGYSTGFVSTVDLKIGPRQWSNTNRTTTPQPPELHRRLREMVDAGVGYAVVESSSHGLRLSRLADVAYDVAVLTNVTSEHLELHGTVEQYRLDKARLFTMLGRSVDKGIVMIERVPMMDSYSKVGIVNADDPSADMFIRATVGPTLTYGTYRHADIVATDIRQSPGGLTCSVRTPAGDTHLRLPMIGAYNVYNALAALAVGLSQSIPLEQCKAALEGFSGVPGRMQRISEGQPFGVIVDYAHTADSLAKVLGTLRAATDGKLFAVFGSAGERDRLKRPAMGKVAATHADFAIFTDEDPRAEDEMSILREIARGAEEAGAVEGTDFLCIPDRREAINKAFQRAHPGDMILLAGKGHEASIEYADHKLPWSDAEVARELLRQLQ